jgi:hypothetical protein
MEIWQLADTKRQPLLDELQRLLDQWDEEGTQTLQVFLGISITGWVYYLREGIHGQSDDQLRTILKHIYENSN